MAVGDAELQLPINRMLERNPGLIRAAIDLHQAGAIPPATYLLDLDAIADNASAMAEAARRLGLRVWVMTKQDGHNPFLAHVAIARGLDGTVAVEAIEANILHRFGLPIRHVGHLVNIPKHQVARMVAMRPEAITVYSVEAARAVSEAATAAGVEQGLYVRVNRVGDETFAGMVGGWDLDRCVEGIAPILDLPNVRIAGLTTHPVISYRNLDAYTAEPTDAFFTMLRGKERLERELGLRDLRVNCAANCNTVTFETLARYGATDVEPGSAMTGSTQFHLHADLPERPAQVYVSEVMHHWEGDVHTLGGGLTWLFQPDEWKPRALVGSTFEEARDRVLELRLKGVVDYFGAGRVAGRQSRIGDTAVYPLLLPQIFMNRAYVAAVSGISTGRPRVEGLFDSATNELDADFSPIAPLETRTRAEALAAQYAAVAPSAAGQGAAARGST
jgi:predicted amino acid racemase